MSSSFQKNVEKLTKIKEDKKRNYHGRLFKKVVIIYLLFLFFSKASCSKYLGHVLILRETAFKKVATFSVLRGLWAPSIYFQEFFSAFSLGEQD